MRGAHEIGEYERGLAEMTAAFGFCPVSDSTIRLRYAGPVNDTEQRAASRPTADMRTPADHSGRRQPSGWASAMSTSAYATQCIISKSLGVLALRPGVGWQHGCAEMVRADGGRI